jgi:4-amino-4-deoxy-L-arabinose transferase-like glycosyltransferase
MKNTRSTGIFLLLLLVSTLAFVSFNGRVHLFDWDEINFAESAREMIVTGDYLTVKIDYQPFWEKPPLFIWMQVLSMKAFGVNEFAARFPNTVAGILTLIMLFVSGKKFSGIRFGLLWCIAYVASFLPFLYFKSGLIDPWFNLFIFSGIICFILYLDHRQSMRWLICSAVLTGLAVLTKGPVALLISMLTAGIFFLFRRFRGFVSVKEISVWFAAFILTGGIWFILMILQGRSGTIVDFFVYQVRLFRTEDAGHGGFPLYHVVVLLVGVFPASVMAVTSFYKNRASDEKQKVFRIWMLILFWVVLVLFSIVKTKIVHYSALCYFPLTFLAALEADHLVRNKKVLSKASFVLVISMMMFWILVALLAPLTLGLFKPAFLKMLHGTAAAPLAMISATVTWPWFTLIPAAVLIASLFFIIRYRKRTSVQLACLVAGTFLFINTAVWFYTSRVEAYSQNANIEFFKGLQGQDVYTRTLGIKSYGRLFYAKKMPPSNTLEYSKNWQLFGPSDKPVYCSFSLNNKAEYLKKYYNLEFLYEKNGYVFCVRNPVKYQKP